jgi:hypothetical protein
MAKDSKKAVYAAEFQEISINIRNLMNYRITILGFCITILGFLFTNIIESDLYQKIILEFFIIFIVYALTKALISMTRHIIIYSFRLIEIEQELSLFGFWQKWGIYLKNNSKDSNSHTLRNIIIILNLLILMFIIGTNSIIYFSAIDSTEKCILTSTTIALILICIFNFRLAYFNLNPIKHWDKMKEDWVNIKKGT